MAEYDTGTSQRTCDERSIARKFDWLDSGVGSNSPRNTHSHAYLFDIRDGVVVVRLINCVFIEPGDCTVENALVGSRQGNGEKKYV